MPACEGRPAGPCPDRRIDRTVHLSQGDLMLCDACERFRFPDIFKVQQRSSSADQKVRSNKHQSRGDGSNNSNVVQSDTTNAVPVVADKSVDDVIKIHVTPIIVSAIPKADKTSSLNKVFWNEILAYICHYRDQSNADSLRRVILNFYSSEDISDAKKLLVQEFWSAVNNCPCITERRNSTSRLAHEAEVDDILGLFDALDTQHALKDCLFVASDFSLVPKFGPEELNVAAVVDKQVRMETAIQTLSASVSLLTSAHGESCEPRPDTHSVSVELQQQMNDLNKSVNQRLDQLSAICSKLAQNVEATSNNATSTARNLRNVEADRSMNIIVFGVMEDRTAAVWRQTVDDALRHVSGHSVDVVDMFRLGRFTSGKVRPILVKLRTAWDRRLILGSSYKLKDFGSRIFVVPDESVEVRRKRMLERIKSHAECDGKSVVVTSDGVLVVDGISVFSIKDGRSQ